MNEVFFGAFDRHNFGDMLFAHLALDESVEPESAILAGHVEADLTAFGGHRVAGLADVMNREPDTPRRLIHVGGEILTCDRWVARITTLGSEDAAQAIARYEFDRDARAAWLDAQQEFASPAPYVVRRCALPPGSHTVFRAVGGVGFSSLDATMRGHVVAALREAESVTVRDSVTRRALAEAGIVAALERDPVARIGERFGRQILDRVPHLGRGHLAVQLGSDFGDDATLDRLAEQLRSIARGSDSSIVLFRAGAAPWHDDVSVLHRLRSRLAELPVSVFDSLDIWDICALIAGASGVIGSSLHVRIVAQAFGRPAISLLSEDGSPTGQATKVRAYVDTWFAEAPHLSTVDDMAAAFSKVAAGR